MRKNDTIIYNLLNYLLQRHNNINFIKMTDHKQFKTVYEDKDVLINENEIQIKWYFFPTAGSKIIPFSKIKHVEFGGLDLLSGQGRLWGMSIGKWGYWFAGDSQRMSRNHFIAIHTNSSVKKAFTT